MAVWSQEKRLKGLAKEMGWAGEPLALLALIRQLIPLMPEKVGAAMKQFYLENTAPEKRENGNYNTRFYQQLLEGRSAVHVVAKLSITELQELIKHKEEGRW